MVCLSSGTLHRPGRPHKAQDGQHLLGPDAGRRHDMGLGPHADGAEFCAEARPRLKRDAHVQHEPIAPSLKREGIPDAVGADGPLSHGVWAATESTEDLRQKALKMTSESAPQSVMPHGILHMSGAIVRMRPILWRHYADGRAAARHAHLWLGQIPNRGQPRVIFLCTAVSRAGLRSLPTALTAPATHRPCILAILRDWNDH